MFGGPKWKLDTDYVGVVRAQSEWTIDRMDIEREMFYGESRGYRLIIAPMPRRHRICRPIPAARGNGALDYLLVFGFEGGLQGTILINSCNWKETF